MKNNLVSLETAKIAKRVGFNYPTYYYAFKNFNAGLDYVSVIDKRSQFGKITTKEDHNHLNKVCERISLPTQNLLRKWIRKRYNFNILNSCNLFKNKYHFQIVLKPSNKTYYEKIVQLYYNILNWFLLFNLKYREQLELQLEKVLKNLLY